MLSCSKIEICLIPAVFFLRVGEVEEYMTDAAWTVPATFAKPPELYLLSEALESREGSIERKVY